MIVWNQSLETGIASIDNQHKELIKRINDFLDACMKQKGKEEINAVLNFLGDYTVQHFRDEEAMHNSSGYAKAAAHKFQHDKFIMDFKALRQLFDREGPSLGVTLTTNKTVVDWLINHINGSDKEFANSYRSK